MSEDEVVARWFASRSHDSLNPCNGADFMGIRPVDWQPLTIDGQPGRTRAACGFVEGVSFVDGRAYLVVAKGEYVYAGARDETVEAFYTTVERLDLQPETAVGVDRLASDVYGYAVRVPANWQVGLATKPWVPGTMPSRSTRADWYDPVDPELQVLVASATIPDGTSEGDWISGFLPTRRQGELGRCTNLGSFMGMPPETWDPMTIAGREGRVRSACGYVDWVEVIGDRAYIVTADGPFRYDGATPSTWAALELFVANLDLRPEDAVATPPYT
jgi:hypothetical protein